MVKPSFFEIFNEETESRYNMYNYENGYSWTFDTSVLELSRPIKTKLKNSDK